MDNCFEYRRIGHAFRGELADLISRQQSAVLLGLRNTGKRYVLRTLADRLTGTAIVVRIHFSHHHSLTTSADLRDIVYGAVRQAAPSFAPAPTAGDAVLDPLRQLCDRQNCAVVLLASNVDSMAHYLAALFLRSVRTLVERHHLTIVLTGEGDLGLLVYGPESEFKCAEQFVIQGFEETEFVDYMQMRPESGILSPADKAGILRSLFVHTGGNLLVARAALWAWQAHYFQIHETEGQRPGSDTFAAFIESFPTLHEYGTDVLSHAVSMVAASRTAFHDLGVLLDGGSVTVCAGAQPHPLELAGFAIREGPRLHLASPIVERFARTHYDACQFGDLYAVQGDWDRAFEFYDRVPLARRLRPNGVDDRTLLSLSIKALVAKLHAEASQKGEASLEQLEVVKLLLIRGCTSLLGASGVTFWTYCGTWRPLSGQTIDADEESLARAALESAQRGTFGWQPLQAPHNQHAALAVLPSIRRDCRDAVIISYLRQPLTISRERQEFHRELLDQFASAYHHTIANVGIKLRLDARQKHLAIATAIINELGRTVRNAREALTLAGRQLLQLGYRRIMFALVDPARKRITGISDWVGEPPTANVADETDYELSQPDLDIQPWVVAHKQCCIVDDWRTWDEHRGALPPINTALCERAGHRTSFAVVPMFIRGCRDAEEVFGTIHVERSDGLPPSPDDIDDLLEFGRQMAAVANQSERVHALLWSLDSDEDAVVIVDHDTLVRFVNKSAGARLGMPDGWHDAMAAIRLGRAPYSVLATAVISSGLRRARHRIYHDAGEERREVVACEPLPDWRAERGRRSALGAVLRIRDLTHLHRLFIALRHVAAHAVDTQTTTDALMACVEDLGYRSARLYRLDPHDSEVLVSTAGLGLPTEFAERFARGDYRMRRGEPDSEETWWCIENGEPRVYQWNPALPNGPVEPTAQGLALTNIRAPALSACWKEPGDAWIDLPLPATGQRTVGKLTIDCGKAFNCELRPEDFELLKLFSALLGALLAALDKEEWVRDAADKAMATCAHNIRTKLAALDGFADRYQRAAPENEAVGKLNRLHQPAVDGCFRQVTRIKEVFAGIQLQPSLTRVKGMLEAALQGMFSKEHDAGTVEWEVTCPEELEFSLDVDHMRNAFEEMFANSRVMLPSGTRLMLGIVADIETRGVQQWLRIRLWDNGPGVPADNRERIFESFYSDRPHGKRSTGLGLSFVRRVVAAHGGRVWVCDGPAGGAEFVIEIPSPKEQ